MSENNKKKEIRRTPIIINKNAVAVIHIFEKYDKMDDIWFSDIERYIQENYDQHAKAAEQFVEQLEGEWCVAFMEALTLEVLLRIKNDSNPKHLERVLQKIDEKFKKKFDCEFCDDTGFSKTNAAERCICVRHWDKG